MKLTFHQTYPLLEIGPSTIMPIESVLWRPQISPDNPGLLRTFILAMVMTESPTVRSGFVVDVGIGFGVDVGF